MEPSYRQKREWLNSRGGTGNGAGHYGGSREIGGYSGQSGQSQYPYQSQSHSHSQMGRNLGGWAPWSGPNTNTNSSLPYTSSDYQPPAAPQANTLWSRERSGSSWSNQDQAATSNVNRSWSGPRPSANGNQWQAQDPNTNQTPKMMSLRAQADEKAVPDHIREELFALSGAKRKWFYRYLDMGCGHEEALSKAAERLTNPAGFKGGSLKWYDKYIASGLSEKEARAKVLEYKRAHPIPASVDRGRKRPEHSVPDDRGRKRPIEENSYGGRAKEEPKKPRRAAASPPPRSSQGSKKGFPVALMPENYPDCVLSRKQLVRIEAGLVDEMRKGWKTSINFGGIQFLPGVIIVTCMDRNTQKWLEHVAPKITVVQGIKLKTCPEDEIPATKAITVFVPRSSEEPDKITNDLLKDQNTDLLSKTWKIMRTTKVKDNKVVTISIGDKSLEMLKKRGMTVSYRFSQLSCRIASDKAALKSVRVNYAEPRPPKPAEDEGEAADESAEIDLTEEDGEEHISKLDLVVVDEVKGDDDEENEVVEEETADDEVELIEGEHDDEEELAEGEPDESYEVDENAEEEQQQEEENEITEEAENENADGEEHEVENADEEEIEGETTVID
ncbi:uncharacterized protein [Drosophila takahashii]|uniref:uncharacterized protein n=1 Tax=Drosophila takahashii TaxID=29030 RepID=UPI001CF80BE7|nr:eukaryotic translation initiation factor 5B [Drosophila takahashii]